MRPTAIKHGITDNYYTTKRQGGTATHANEFLRKTNSITEKEKKGGGVKAHLTGPTHNWRGQSVGEQIRTGLLTKQINKLFWSCCIATLKLNRMLIIIFDLNTLHLDM